MSPETRDLIYLHIEAERLRQLRTQEEVQAPPGASDYLSELVEIKAVVDVLIAKSAPGGFDK